MGNEDVTDLVVDGWPFVEVSVSDLGIRSLLATATVVASRPEYELVR